jgi:hypothetical protein
MKNNKSILIVIGALASTITSVNAQSKFEGAYGQVGIGYESVSPSTSTTLTYGGSNIPTSIGLNNSNSFAGTATLGYTFAVTKDFMLGFGGEYSPIESQKQNISINLLGQSVPAGSYQKKNSYNFFLSPGLMVGTDALAYAKVGYTGASFDTGGDTTNYTGYSLGLGYKQIITGGLYGFGEVNYASYGNQTSSQSTVVSGNILRMSVTSSANVTNILLGLGYKF